MNEPPIIQRALFIEALSKAVDCARAESTHVGLLLIDITNLSQINHCHGYHFGDHILSAAYRALLGISKLPDTVFRLGSHHFAFILPQLANPAFIALALNRVTQLLHEELFIDADMIGADLKVGVSFNPAGSRDAMTSLALAESSLAQVKMGASHHIEDLENKTEAQAVDHQLQVKFPQALHDNEFQLYFQPKVCLHSGQVRSAEALLRWIPEGGNPVPPEMVVELADAAGRAFDLSKWVIHSCMRQLNDWGADVDVGLALNLQAGLVSNSEVPALLRDAVRIWGVEADKLTVEITESGLIEDKQSGFENLLKITELGVKLSIDDFGTGYSSLSYFKHIPAAEVKIDRTFVSTMLEDEQNLELVKIIILIAHQFKMTVVAEGVENRATLEALRDLGCDHVQGYYLSEPLPAEQFASWLRGWSGLPRD